MLYAVYYSDNTNEPELVFTTKNKTKADDYVSRAREGDNSFSSFYVRELEKDLPEDTIYWHGTYNVIKHELENVESFYYSDHEHYLEECDLKHGLIYTTVSAYDLGEAKFLLKAKFEGWELRNSGHKTK